MSACISRHGEYAEHDLDADFTCTLCGVLDEESMRAELRRLRDGQSLGPMSADRAALARVEALLREHEHDDRHHLDAFGQHHPVAAIAAEHLRAALAPTTGTESE